jgi:hypothetical protein
MALGLGVFDGTTESCTAFDVDDAATTTDTQANYADKAVQLYEFGGTTHDLMFEGTFSSFGASGYNLSFPTSVDSTARKWLSIAIKGEAATGDTFVNATTDALTLTEQGATVAADVGVSATTDSLTLTEQAATIAADVTVPAGVQALSLTTLNPTVTYTVTTNVQTIVQSLDLTTYSAEIEGVVPAGGGLSMTEEEFRLLERKQMKELELKRIAYQVQDDEEIISLLY